MHRVLTALLVVVAAVARAAEEAALKAEPAIGAAPAPVLDFRPLLQMLIALAIVVVAIKYGLPRLMGAAQKKMSTSLGGAIRIEESATIPGGSLYLVTVRDRTLLLGITAQGVQNLADLTPSPDTPAAPPAFFELVDQRLQAPATHAVIVEPEVETQVAVVQTPKAPAAQPAQTDPEAWDIDEDPADAPVGIQRMRKRGRLSQDEVEEALKRLRQIAG